VGIRSYSPKYLKTLKIRSYKYSHPTVPSLLFVCSSPGSIFLPLRTCFFSVDGILNPTAAVLYLVLQQLTQHYLGDSGVFVYRLWRHLLSVDGILVPSSKVTGIHPRSHDAEDNGCSWRCIQLEGSPIMAVWSPFRDFGARHIVGAAISTDSELPLRRSVLDWNDPTGAVLCFSQ
jgi:hypothetical protein